MKSKRADMISELSWALSVWAGTNCKWAGTQRWLAGAKIESAGEKGEWVGAKTIWAGMRSVYSSSKSRCVDALDAGRCKDNAGGHAKQASGHD